MSDSVSSKSKSLVERLRTPEGLMVPYGAVKTMAEAADEIDRLRGALEGFASFHGKEAGADCPMCRSSSRAREVL